MKLLVIVVRGLQAAAAGPYGNRWIETFTLDALAAQGVVFDHHLAVHPDPADARRVWRTGCYHFPLPPGGEPPAGPWPDLLAALGEARVATRLVLDAGRPAPPGWADGWGEVRRVPDTEAAVEAARSALAELAAAPSWLLWLEVGALLPPWRPAEEIVEAYFAPPPLDEDEEEAEGEEGEEPRAPEPWEEPLEPLLDPPAGPIDPDDDDLFLRVQTSYAAAVSHVDGLLGGLLDGLADDVHVFLTADHGQALGEHTVVGPVRPWLHQEVVHVPLIVAGPGCRAGRHVGALTASVDLAATVAELAGARLEGSHGVSLAPLFGGGDRQLRPYVGLGARVGDEVEWGLRSPRWALRVPVAPEGLLPSLYVKPDDRWEVNDVRQHHLERLEGMERTLRGFVEACRRPGPVAPPELEA
jgi:arylsulfatase A-like enzyme